MVAVSKQDEVGRTVGPLVRNEVTAPVEGSVVQVGSVQGGLHLHPVPRSKPVPRQLPVPPGLFTGRHEELAHLTKVIDADVAPRGTVMISAIGGAGGIGKTALALHWAHQYADRFPDGQLYVNLRGFDPTGQPLSPAVAIHGFLDALGVEPTAIPVDLQAQTALYRSLVAGKRLLVMLDNARDTAQIEPLLAGSSTCTVVITSRQRLAGMVVRGASLLDLDVLTDTEARELLARHLGADRLDAEPGAVDELLGWCAGLPLAIRIVAARAQMHPRFALASLAEELRDASSRLDALDAGDDLAANVRAVLSWSYHALGAEASAMFRILGLAPGADISLPAVAGLASRPTAQTRTLLHELEAAYLVTQHKPGRYRLHDLVRLYADEQARKEGSPQQCDAVVRRSVQWFSDRVALVMAPPSAPERPSEQALCQRRANFDPQATDERGPLDGG